MSVNNYSIIKPYVPRHFGKEYFNIKGYSQYAMFASVALGVKPSFDDWIPIGKFQEFLDACKGYGLTVEPDVIFTKEPLPKDKIVGGANITTTFSSFIPFNAHAKNGEVHVFIAKTRENALKAKRYGWYALVANGRYINKPYIDNIRFGRALGYPECCIDFFRRYNNWFKYSNPSEAYKHTPKMQGKAVGSYYCNNFLMDKTYSFIHHIPCSYQCQSTIALGKKVEDAISAMEPNFIIEAKGMLKKPLLVFAEQHFIIFEGWLEREGDEEIIHYRNAQYVTNPSRPEESMSIKQFLAKGDRITISAKEISIKEGDDIIKAIRKNERWFALDFD